MASEFPFVGWPDDPCAPFGSEVTAASGVLAGSGVLFGLPEKFTNPFRYFPHPLVVRAASEVVSKIDNSEELRAAFSEGKMLGVLICAIPETAHHVIPETPHHVIPGLTRNLPVGYLAAFSGNVGGKSHIEGFVPPIFDLLEPSGYFKAREAEISDINLKIKALKNSSGLSEFRRQLAEAERLRDKEIAEMRSRMAEAKRKRDELREQLTGAAGVGTSDPAVLDALIKESQFEKAELRRLKADWQAKIAAILNGIRETEVEIAGLKSLRSQMSDELQEWIFRQYIIHNSLGEEASIFDIFSSQGLVPPGGTGECAAPKLLEYAFRNGLKPIAMGEFWYGKSPETAVRTQGHFYPSCTSKCGPLLGFMLKGLDISDDMDYGSSRWPDTGSEVFQSWESSENQESSSEDTGRHYISGLKVIYKDEVLIAVDKPSGMPSVPGLDGRKSAFEILQETFGELFTVHRLDMDTSGVLLFAKTAEAAVNLQKQFESHTVRKTYLARLSADSLCKLPSTQPPTVAKSLCTQPSTQPPTVAKSLCTQPSAQQSSAANSLSKESSFRKPLKVGDKGRIELPLSPDYDERPRQKVDFKQGKAAITDYEVKALNEDGTIDILFSPLTGRTHQLRVHAAHTLGLHRPILGDPLYGGTLYSPIPGSAPKDTPEVTLEATPEVAPKDTLKDTPKAAPEVTLKTTPKVTPKATPKATPEATPEVTPEATITQSPHHTQATHTGSPAPRLHLHAASITFQHPATHKEMSILTPFCSFQQF